MNAVDTNILIRWITRDDPEQARRADALLAHPTFVSLTVLLETAWVLSGRPFNFNRATRAGMLHGILETESITVASDEGVRWAIERFAAGADFADMIHMVAARGATRFVSFEKELAREAGDDAPLQIAQPA
ncbi:type II toxin-antitoxin system VapC family toxin [uncultured Sphingomonas sp.]|uniref:type II toxin-antitoxin system VapC family toxin n=1 Tax=uncultured Sphingomonas sp. TaxID=158754 RepID=UPI0035CA89FE